MTNEEVIKHLEELLHRVLVNSPQMVAILTAIEIVKTHNAPDQEK